MINLRLYHHRVFFTAPAGMQRSRSIYFLLKTSIKRNMASASAPWLHAGLDRDSAAGKCLCWPRFTNICCPLAHTHHAPKRMNSNQQANKNTTRHASNLTPLMHFITNIYPQSQSALAPSTAPSLCAMLERRGRTPCRSCTKASQRTIQ